MAKIPEEVQDRTTLHKLQLSFEMIMILQYTKEKTVYEFFSQTSIKSHVPKQKHRSDCYMNVT